MSKMAHPEQCRIIKGYFPDSLLDLPERDELLFSFVSLDADLYQPIYDALCYFYPKLVCGGYIMVHDYNGGVYHGVKAAVREFEKENKISFVPIPDISGSIVITKTRYCN